uniref:CSON013481 protein n=1 Tax=Culicoides sonorensis TaxID=179676 RepID=A0A336LS10_CULSO
MAFLRLITKNALQYSNKVNLTIPTSVVTVINSNKIPSRFYCNEKLAIKSEQKHDWNRAVSEAEKIVGYPTSFLSLRWLLSDEIANVALHLRQLVGSNHPLLKTAKNLIYNGKTNMQAWGLIVLLVSKAAGYSPNIPAMEEDKSAGVLHSQRALAEVTEMIRTSHLVHQGLINLQPLANSGNDLSSESDMIFGNKIALLSGDYLLGSASVELAKLRNQDLNELISSAFRDLSESNFIGDRDDQNNPLPSDPRQKNSEALQNYGDNFDNSMDVDNLSPMEMKGVMGNPEIEWAVRHILSAGSLLGKSCQGALKLAGLDEDLQKQGYLFGKNLALAWQACIDLEPFKFSTIPTGAQFSLVSAPVLFHLEYDPSLYEEIKKGKKSVENINYEYIHSEILKGPGLEKTRNLARKHCNRTNARYFCYSYKSVAKLKDGKVNKWNRVVSDAEKIVGYPSSFLSLRWLLSDEVANIAIFLRQLVGSNHPLLKTAKTLIYNGKNNNNQSYGLIVLLLSKAAGCASTIEMNDQEKNAGILNSQRALAEVTEMLRISHIIHQGLLNLQNLENHGNDLESENDKIFGNKVALLGGDKYLAKAFAELAKLRNQDLNLLIATAFRDLSESNFIGDRDDQNNPLPSDPNQFSSQKTSGDDYDNSMDTDNLSPMDMKGVMGNPEQEWVVRNILSAGSLLGKSCQGALKLAGLDEDLQKQAYLFGKHLALAWQACIDLEPFKFNTFPIGAQLNLVSAPVLFHLEYDPSLYEEIKKGKESIEQINHEYIYSEILKGPGLEKTRHLIKKHNDAALLKLSNFSDSEARKALGKIILAKQNS